jgi:Rad3-related DNA helicase
LKATVDTATQPKGLNFNRLERASQKRQIKKENVQELLHRTEALRDRVSNLRLQCEELRTILNEKPDEATLCSECGQKIERNEEVVFKGANEKRTFCKKCFGEMWK